MKKIPIQRTKFGNEINKTFNDSLSYKSKYSKERIVDGHRINIDRYMTYRDDNYRTYYAHDCMNTHCNVTVRRYIVHYESDYSCDESKLKGLLK